MPTDWEDHYQRGETPWNRGEACPGLVDFLALEPVRGRVLVPGCGFGFDVRALAATADEVTGIDVAPSAIKGARAAEAIGGERYELRDLFALPESWRGQFDWVWEHTCFCAIDRARRSDYVRAVARALRPGGQLLAIFYLDPGHENPDDGPPFGVSTAQLDALFSPAFELLREWRPARVYAGREGGELMRLLRRSADAAGD